MGTSEGTNSAEVSWIRRIYWILIPLTLGFMLFHHGVDFLHKVRKGRRRARGEEITRMNLNFRIAHWLTAVSFPVLVFTGFALRYPEAWWARPCCWGKGVSIYAARCTAQPPCCCWLRWPITLCIWRWCGRTARIGAKCCRRGRTSRFARDAAV